MNTTQDYQKAISHYKARISFVLITLLLFLVFIGLEVKQLLSIKPAKVVTATIELKRLEFEILWQGLANKSKPIILEQVIEAEKGIGKAEPFQ
jgi:hypothetical protein